MFVGERNTDIKNSTPAMILEFVAVVLVIDASLEWCCFHCLCWVENMDVQGLSPLGGIVKKLVPSAVP